MPSTFNARRPIAVFAAVLAALVGEAAFAQDSAPSQPPPQLDHRGMVLAAIPPPPTAADGDTSLVGPSEGLESLRAALDALYSRSPFSAAALETLKANGNVFVLYQPQFPETTNNLHDLSIAGFYPEYFQKEENGTKDFVVAVGRHGIKWPTEELAAVLVHELVGHGIQHLEGRLEFVREIDLECEAMLYMERFYQDARIDKFAGDIIRFRKALEQHWCSDFRRHMREHTPEMMALWDVLNPDVVRLLAAFETYVAGLRDTGVPDDAIDAAKRLREEPKAMRQ